MWTQWLFAECISLIGIEIGGFCIFVFAVCLGIGLRLVQGRDQLTVERWQIHRKAVPWLKGLVFSAGFLFFLYILPPLIFSIPAVQRSAAEAVEAELERLLQTEVSLRRVTLHEWNDISVEGVVIRDSLGREAIKLAELRAGFEWSRLLLEEHVRISSIRLFAPHLDLHYDRERGRLNISPLLERLSSGDTTSRTTLGLQSLLVRDGSVRLSSSGSGVVEVDSITLNLSRIVIEEPFYGCNIQEISLRYAKELELRRFSGQIQMQGDRLSLVNLQGSLPSGRVHLPSLRLNMGAKGLGMIDEVRIAGIYFSLSDLNPLLDDGALPASRASLSATISRLGGGLRIDSLSADITHWLNLRSDMVVDLDREGGILGVHSPHLELKGRADSLCRSAWGVRMLGGSLSEALSSLGEIHYLGDIAWLAGDGVGASGSVTSDLGVVGLRDMFVGLDSLGPRLIEGEASTRGFDLSPLLGHQAPIGEFSGYVRGDLRRGLTAMDWRGDASLQIDHIRTKGYGLGNIRLQVEGKGGGRFGAKIESLDPTISLSGGASARVTALGLEDISFRLLSPRIVPSHFVGGLDMLSCEDLNVEGELSSLDLRTANGRIQINSLAVQRGGDRVDLGSSSLHVRREGSERQLRLQTPWLALDVRGRYHLDDIGRHVLHSLYRSSPLLEDLAPGQLDRTRAPTATLALRLDSIPLSVERILNLPVHIPAPLQVLGEYEGATDHFSLGLESTELVALGKRIKALKLEMNETGLDAKASEVRPLEGDPLLSPSLSIDHLGDSLRINLNIGRDPDAGENGYVNLDARLLSRSPRVRSLQDLEAQISLSPSQIRIHSASWSVDPAKIRINSDGLSVYGFAMRTEGRAISMDGVLGNMGMNSLTDPINPLSLKLDRINLRYILSALGVDFSMLDTDLSGRIWADYSDGVLNAKGQVHSPHFFLEGKDTGALVADLRFDTKEANINLQAEVTDSIGGSTLVGGYIRPGGGAGLDLHFEAEGFHLGFVQTFLSGVFDRIDGRVTGHIRLFGRFEEGVTIEGGLSVEGGMIALGSLGTKYYFDDEVSFKPEEMNFTGIRLRDDNGGRGYISRGIVRHKHFDDFSFDLLVQEMNKMKVLDLPTKGTLPVYGLAYASGESRIRGGSGRIFISNTLRSEEGTDVTLDFSNSSFERGNKLMRFVPLRDTIRQTAPLETGEVKDEGTPIDMLYTISLRPTAKVALRLGVSEQDVIKGWGEGEVRIDVPHTGTSMVNGELVVHGGQYDFRLKQLMYKQLRLHEGGRVVLQGDPYQAQLDLKASYEVQANISDLDEQLSRQIGQTNIPVQCIVNIGGTAGKPELKLELGLPRVDSEVERRIRSIVNTEEEVNRQFLSLFILGKFYSGGSAPTTTGNNSTNTLAALASTLISDQLSSFIGNLSNKVRLGTSVRVGGANFEDTEIGLNYAINLLNNRFLLRGNLGYHESALQDEGTYLTDFDAEYRLSRTLSLRAYNHYNTMYRYLKSGATTQGLGLRFRQAYDRLSELFRPLYRSSDSIPQSGNRVPSDSLAVDEISHD